LVDLEGQQSVDFLCYNAENHAERYSAINTVRAQGNISITKRTVLYSNKFRPLFRVTEDSCGGGHETLSGCCSTETNMLRFRVRDTPSCRSNFREILSCYGLDDRDIVANINFFMRTPINPDGSLGVSPGSTRPGDHILLQAEMDVLAVLSNCPQRRTPTNGFYPTPIQATVFAAGDEV
jgi:urea carboxylase-associated protein 1